MGDRANLEALYRHLRSRDVSLSALLAPHVARTIERARAARTVFALADSTAYKFGGESERDGLGPVNTTDQGFLAHVTLLVAADGTRTPLGVIAAETWTRSGSGEAKPSSTKESARWGRSMKHATEVAAGASLVHVADRESDIFELLGETREREVLSINAQGRAREYQLRLLSTFRVVDKNGLELIAPTTLTARRDISFNESELLAKESEEAMLYRDMQSDLVRQMVTQKVAETARAEKTGVVDVAFFERAATF